MKALKLYRFCLILFEEGRQTFDIPQCLSFNKKSTGSFLKKDRRMFETTFFDLSVKGL